MQHLNIQTLTLDEMTELDAGAATTNYGSSPYSITDTFTDAGTTDGGYSLESMWSFEA